MAKQKKFPPRDQETGAAKAKHYGASRSTKRAVTLTVVIGLLVVIAAVWITAAVMQANRDTNAFDSTTPNTDVEVEQVQRTVTGNPIDTDRQAALDAAQEVLTAAVIEDEDTFVETMQAMDTEGFNAEHLPEGLTDSFRFEDTMQEEDRQVNSVQAVLTIAQIATQFADTAGTVEPIATDAWQYVHVDSELGIAFVPVSVFTGTETGYSLMMVFTENEQWQLDPYPLLDSVTLGAMIQQNMTPEEMSNVPGSTESSEE